MLSLPTEVFFEIFKSACTDDGTTGRALSRVSRRFCEASRDFKLQSVAVTDARQIRDFAQSLEDMPSRFRRVHHLFISNLEESSKKRKQRCRLFDQKERGFWEYDPDTSAAFVKILELVAPTLITLHFVSDIPRTTLLPPVSLPQLTSATMHGLIHVYNLELPELRFPSLRHLSLLSFTEYPICLLQEISQQAPSLTHLFFSPERPSRQLAFDLFLALKPQQSAALLGSTQSIMIQPSMRHIPEIDIWITVTHRAMLKELFEVVELDKRVTIVEPEQTYNYRQAKLCWLKGSTVFT